MAVGPSGRMSDPDGIPGFLRSKLRAAGRQYAEAREAYGEGKTAAVTDLPTDEEGRAKLVCRRYAERRAVTLDGDGRPACYEDHPDCEGCVEDIRDGTVQTWE